VEGNVYLIKTTDGHLHTAAFTREVTR